MALDDTKLAAGKEYLVNFTEQQKKFCLSFHCNGVNSYLFVNGVKIYKFKEKGSEINASSICLGNVSKDYMKNTGLYGCIIWICYIDMLIMIVLMLLTS